MIVLDQAACNMDGPITGFLICIRDFVFGYPQMREDLSIELAQSLSFSSISELGK